MKKQLKKITSLLLMALPVVLITGCSTITYEEPKSGPVARVRFVTNTRSMMVVRGYKSTECDDEHEMMRLRNGFLLISDPKRLGIPLWDFHDNAAKEFFIPADVPQTYLFKVVEREGRMITKCGVFLKQTFEKNKDYELNYHLNGIGCRIDVYELKRNQSNINSEKVEKVLLQSQNHTLSSDFSPSCMTRFKQIRLY